MQAIEITWTEVSQHRVSVLVPDDFDTDTYDYDLENQLGELSTTSFVGVERADVMVCNLPIGDDPTDHLEEFTPQGTPW